MATTSPQKTPKTPQAQNGQPKPGAQTPSQQPTSYRLLYRGALSLPDSHILLDGLTFTVKLESPSKSVTSSLLDNPLALALESMRGRPSLQFLGVIKLADVYMDESGSIEMDIHPRAILSRIYFENMFCLKPFPGSSQQGTLKSEIGIKIALGDSDGPETTQIVVYAQLKPPELGQENAITVQLKVARLTLHPPQQRLARIPRPDDPIPRRPPIIFGRDMQRVDSRGTLSKGSDLKRVASGSLALNGPGKRVKLVGGGGSVSNLGSGVRLGPTLSSGDVFKVPELPRQASKSTKRKEKEDVFGGGARNIPSVGITEDPMELDDFPMGDELDGGAMERGNKNAIKKATIAYLAQTKDPAKKGVVIDKQHPDFKEFYGAVYRGVCFAVRGRIRLETVDPAIVERLLRMHTRMYLTGLGPPAT